jgi:hypothetical protein
VGLTYVLTIFVVTVVAAILGGEVRGPAVIPVLCLSLAIALAASAATCVRGYRRKVDREQRRLTEEKAKAAAHEAERVTTHVRELLVSSNKMTTRLPDLLMQTSHALRRADQEYRENAFGPFWDAVEDAARSLDAIRGAIDELGKSAHSYYNVLEGRRHTFAGFPVRRDAVPDTRPVIEHFRSIVRM